MLSFEVRLCYINKPEKDEIELTETENKLSGY